MDVGRKSRKRNVPAPSGLLDVFPQSSVYYFSNKSWCDAVLIRQVILRDNSWNIAFSYFYHLSLGELAHPVVFSPAPIVTFKRSTFEFFVMVFAKTKSILRLAANPAFDFRKTTVPASWRENISSTLSNYFSALRAFYSGCSMMVMLGA
jgi:hypothetical protein